MTFVITEILGRADDARFADRRVESVPVSAADASRPRLRLTGAEGSDVAVNLERGTFLFDGAVLHDDGERIIVVARALEQALVVRLDSALTRAEIIGAVARIAHAFGNQHAPVDVQGEELRVLITTSPEIALATIERLGLAGVDAAVQEVQLAREGPLAGRADHHHQS